MADQAPVAIGFFPELQLTASITAERAGLVIALVEDSRERA